MHPCVLKFPALCYPESLVGVGFYRAVAFAARVRQLQNGSIAEQFFLKRRDVDILHRCIRARCHACRDAAACP